MDTTPKYILMSEKAKGWLSNYYKGKPGDLHVGRDGRICMVDSNILTDGVLHPDCIPLFRQDQLQDMLEKTIWNLVWDFEEFTEDMTDPSCFELKSFEQLWLAFVMKEKYSKQWVNEKWVKCQVAQ